MQFQNPTYLWALLAIILPIIIHLFYFKRFKKVYFTNLWTLREVKDETSMRNKLRDLLTLLMRILAIAALVFAFVQPIFNKDGKQLDLGKKAISVFVDNSFSMQAKKDEVILLDVAKQKAKEIIQAYSSNDEFNVLSNDLSPTQLRFINKEQALEAVDAIEISPSRKKLDIIENKQRDILSSVDTKGRSYILSDFQENITEFTAPIDTNLRNYLVPIQSVRENNVSIDSIWLVAPLPMINESNNLMIRIVNLGDQDVQDLRLNLTQDGQTRPIATYDIAANESKIDTVKIVVNKAGWQELTFNISDYPIVFDDKYMVSFEVKEKIDVLSIYEGYPNKSLEAAYNGTNSVDYKAVSYKKVDYGSIGKKELIVLTNLNKITSGLINALQTYVEGGGNIFITPSKSIDMQSYNKLMTTLKIDRFAGTNRENKETSYINTQEFIFSNVFIKKDKNIKMPNSSMSYTLISSAARPRESIIKYRDGSPYISKYKYGNGNVYTCVSPLDESVNSLTQNAEIFVPLVYKMAISTVASDKLAQVIAQDETLKISGIQEDEQNILKIISSDNKQEFIPGQQLIGPTMVLDVNSQVKSPGFYYLKRGTNHLGTWAYNFNREESRLGYLSPEELEVRYGEKFDFLDIKQQENLTNIIKEKNEGLSLWKWALIAALIFLGIETLLLRMRKN